MRNKILIVDDETDIVSMLKDYFELNGYDTITAVNGLEAIQKAEKQPDIILLDINMPDIDGMEVCMRIRDFVSCPILFLTARIETSDKIKGFSVGADDYIIKPFDSKELVARVKAVLRRYQAVPKPEVPAVDKGKCVEYPGIEINLTNYSVLVDGQNVEMPPKELELLYFLASSPNQVFTREQLLDQIWGYEYIGDTRTVDVHIKRLREKIKDHNGWKLATVWGIGYKFEVK